MPPSQSPKKIFYDPFGLKDGNRRLNVISIKWPLLVLISFYITDSKAVVDGNLKLILGLIWTLIQHYSLSISGINNGKKRGKKQSPEQELLTWVQSKIPKLNIKNFKSDWRNGVALGALVDSVGSGKSTKERAVAGVLVAVCCAGNELLKSRVESRVTDDKIFRANNSSFSTPIAAVKLPEIFLMTVVPDVGYWSSVCLPQALHETMGFAVKCVFKVKVHRTKKGLKLATY